MAKNIAARRHAKAVRRKAVVAEKRRADELGQSLAAQVRTAAFMPIQHCLITNNLFDIGMGQILLLRGEVSSDMQMALFLVDLAPYRIKDVGLRPITRRQLDEYRVSLAGASLEPIRPEDARRLLHEVVARGSGAGIRSHQDYEIVEQSFGTVDASASDAVFPWDSVLRSARLTEDPDGEATASPADPDGEATTSAADPDREATLPPADRMDETTASTEPAFDSAAPVKET